MNEPQTTDAGQASVASGEAEPSIFDHAAMQAACQGAVATCATELQVFNDKLKARTDLEKVHQQLVDRAASARAALDVALAEQGNAEASLMLAEASAEIDGSTPDAALSEAVEPARKAVAAARADLARLDAALGILPSRIAQAEAELDQAAADLKEPIGAAIGAVNNAQGDLMMAASGPLCSALIVGYALSKMGLSDSRAFDSVVIPRPLHNERPLVNNGNLIPREGEVMKLAEHIQDVPEAEALLALLRPLGQARRAMVTQMDRARGRRIEAQHRANEARGGKFSLDGPQSHVVEVAAGTQAPAVTGMPEMVYRTPGVREGG
jgi:hypothetical protein